MFQRRRRNPRIAPGRDLLEKQKNPGAGWVKLEVLGDKKTLLPDPLGTLEATRELVKEGFTVLCYTSDDPIAARRLKEAGAASVMPAGSPIGSGQGVLNPLNISLCLETLKENDPTYPVIVDAGVGTASDVTIAMELGADGVLLNTGIAHAKDPVKMAHAMRHALESGRLAYQAGRIPREAIRHRKLAVCGRDQLYSRRMNDQWTALAANAGRTLDPSQHERLSRYLDLLLAANLTMNLTRITDRAAAELHHVSDSLTLLPLLPQGEFRLADVGSGGGVPGIPLAIARPDAEVFLIESTRKKAAFLQRAVAELAVTNVRISDQRAEEVARTKHRETFDVAVARAVATLDFLAEYCLPLVKVGGSMLAMKGPKVLQEIPTAQHAIRMLGGGEPKVHPVMLSGAEHHVIVEITKRRRTSDKYPRPPSQQKGRPLHD